MGKLERVMKFCKSSTVLFGCGVAAVIIIAAVFFVSEGAEAKVRGRCDNCHTMHNSQDGAGMVVLAGPTEIAASAPGNSDCAGCHAEPRENLLTLSCIGCHVDDVSGPALVNMGGFNSPQVAYQTTDSLAAGNFVHVFQSEVGAFAGHNVHGFGAGVIEPDVNQGVWPTPINTHPGYDAALDCTTAGYRGCFRRRLANSA